MTLPRWKRRPPCQGNQLSWLPVNAAGLALHLDSLRQKRPEQLADGEGIQVGWAGCIGASGGSDSRHGAMQGHCLPWFRSEATTHRRLHKHLPVAGQRHHRPHRQDRQELPHRSQCGHRQVVSSTAAAFLCSKAAACTVGAGAAWCQSIMVRSMMPPARVPKVSNLTLAFRAPPSTLQLRDWRRRAAVQLRHPEPGGHQELQPHPGQHHRLEQQE